MPKVKRTNSNAHFQCENKNCKKYKHDHIRSDKFKSGFHKNCEYKRCSCNLCPEKKIAKTKA